jgi:hypothetical protein
MLRCSYSCNYLNFISIRDLSLPEYLPDQVSFIVKCIEGRFHFFSRSSQNTIGLYWIAVFWDTTTYVAGLVESGLRVCLDLCSCITIIHIIHIIMIVMIIPMAVIINIMFIIIIIIVIKCVGFAKIIIQVHASLLVCNIHFGMTVQGAVFVIRGKY